MTTIITIRNVINGVDLPLSEDEQNVIDMICNLTACTITDMPNKADRTAAVAELPANLADKIKAEIVKIFDMRRTAS